MYEDYVAPNSHKYGYGYSKSMALDPHTLGPSLLWFCVKFLRFTVCWFM